MIAGEGEWPDGYGGKISTKGGASRLGHFGGWSQRMPSKSARSCFPYDSLQNANL